MKSTGDYEVDDRGVLAGPKVDVTSIRPDADVDETLEWMKQKDLDRVPVTDPEGVLLGVFLAGDV